MLSAAHREDLSREKSHSASQDTELQALREQVISLTAKLNEVLAAPAPAPDDDSTTEQYQRQIAHLEEELALTKESAELTKTTLVEQIEYLSEHREQDLEEAARARVEEVDRLEAELSAAVSDAREEIEGLKAQMEEERELKNKGSSRLS
jgi:hypothetical protein